MPAQGVNIFWFVISFVLGMGACVSVLHLIAWIRDKKHPPNPYEWLDKNMNKEHYFMDPDNAKVQIKGTLIDINPLKGHRPAVKGSKGNKPNYEFVFRVGKATVKRVPIGSVKGLVR